MDFRIRVETIFILFLGVTMVFPFSSLFGINIKIISVLVLFAALVKQGNILLNVGAKFSIFFFFLLGLFLYSVINGEANHIWTFKQLFDMAVFYLVFLIVSDYSIKNNRSDYVLNIIAILLSIAAIVKFLVIYIAYKKNMLMSDFIQNYNLNYLTLNIKSSFLQRVTSQLDAIIPVVFFYILIKGNSKGFLKSDIIIISLLIFSVLISMSRYIWFASLFSLGLYFVISKNSIWKFLLIIFGFFICTLIYISGFFSDIFEIRNDSDTNEYSDGIRLMQKESIINAISQQPFLGHGLGYYLPNLIRSDNAKYLYELQIPALIMQIGFIGFLVFLVFILSPFFNIKGSLSNINKFIILTLFVIWVGNSFLNPYLFSSPGGIALASLLLLANSHYLRNKTIRVS